MCASALTRAECKTSIQINGDPDTTDSDILDNPSAALADRLRSLQKQLKDRDDALEEAGSVADDLVKTSGGRRITLLPLAPAQHAGWGLAPSGERSTVPQSRSAGGVMPQKVARPSWLAAADPSAGGSRLKDSLQVQSRVKLE